MFDLVFCVGNSLGHAQGTAGRLAGSRVDVRDRLIRRNDRAAVVSYYWQTEQQWEQEHFLEISVAQIEPDGAVRPCSERLSIWPFRYEDLVAELRTVGLKVVATTFDPAADGYTVVAESLREPGSTSRPASRVQAARGPAEEAARE